MHKRFLLFALVLLPFIAVSQNTKANYRNQIKFSAFRTINFLNPGVEFSYERLHTNKLSTSISAGIATNALGGAYTKLRGFNMGAEEKYFLSKKIKRGNYFSVAVNHSAVKYQDDTYGNDMINNRRIIDTFTISRKTTSLSFIYGIEYYKKHFLLDINLGAGIKYRNVKHYDRIFEYIGPREAFDLDRAANVEGARFAAYLPIHIQLGYRF
ncbi:MAG: hypothetical protein ABI266_05485 [Ginsengibacter sp.]